MRSTTGITDFYDFENDFTLHLNLRTNDAYLVDRSLQAFEAGNFIRQTQQGSDVVIFCGDFNTEKDDLPHQVLTKVFGLKDSHPV